MGDEDGEDYSWEYEDEEEEAEPVPELPKEAPKETPKEKVNTTSKVEDIQKRRERINVEDPEPPKRLGKSDRDDILEQMKRLQEGMQIDVDDEESDYSLTDDDDEPVKPKKEHQKKEEEEELDLSDMDLLDPFGDEAVPIIPKKDR